MAVPLKIRKYDARSRQMDKLLDPTMLPTEAPGIGTTLQPWENGGVLRCMATLVEFITPPTTSTVGPVTYGPTARVVQVLTSFIRAQEYNYLSMGHTIADSLVNATGITDAEPVSLSIARPIYEPDNYDTVKFTSEPTYLYFMALSELTQYNVAPSPGDSVVMTILYVND